VQPDHAVRTLADIGVAVEIVHLDAKKTVGNATTSARPSKRNASADGAQDRVRREQGLGHFGGWTTPLSLTTLSKQRYITAFSKGR